MHNWQRYPSSN